MSFELKRKLYENCPAVFQKMIGLVPFGLIAGKTYRSTIACDAKTDRAGPAEIEAIENEHLGRILAYATQRVPFYQPYRSLVERMAPQEAIRGFPTIDKDIVQERFEEFLSLDRDSIPNYETSTGGTSGNQLRIILENDSHYRETAFIHRLWKRVGFNTSSRKATFRGQVFSVENGKYWRTNPIYRELQFSTFHLAPDNINQYVAKLNSFLPHFLHGYPSVISTIARHLMANSDCDLTANPHAILLGSEATTEQQRETIERGFGCRAYSWFGHSERLVLGGECEQNSTYHQIPDYGLLEILKGENSVRHGDRGEIVGTTYWNRVMPLIRYRTGDYATKLEGRCECGRYHRRFTDVQGRWNQEFLLGRSGAKVFSTALNMHGDAFEHVLRYQYVQSEPGRVTVRVMPSAGFTDADERKIRDEHEKRLAHDFEIVFETVENIELTKRGKLRRILQNIPSAKDS